VLSALVIGSAAFAVSILTLFSGFGLGTLLMPVFALFFPVAVAVASTAVVHLLNNLFKLALLARSAVPRVLLAFGLPAVGAAFLGALALNALAHQRAIQAWQLGARRFEVTPVNLTMGLLILGFAVVELAPERRMPRLDPRWLPLGGVLSGFFGGLSGHQGALRAAFLRRADLSPTAFAATTATLACMVDLTRLVVYGAAFLTGRLDGAGDGIDWPVVGTATACAFGGSYAGRRLLPKVTLGVLHWITGGLLAVVGAGLASGVLG
jgi:uncharacterized membrane protein YfcA